MREIHTLQATNDDNSAARSSRQVKRGLFAAGFMLAVLAGAAGFALWLYANSLETELNVDRQVALNNEILNESTPGEVFEVWTVMTSQGLPDWRESAATRYNKQAGFLKMFAYGLAALAGIGLLMVMSSFFGR